MSTNLNDPSVFQNWLDSLKQRDPQLHKELGARLQQRVTTPETVRAPDSGITLETVAREGGVDLAKIALETIVREGRPALPTKENHVVLEGATADAAAQTIIDRLKIAAPVVETAIPLVGRIDVDNHPTSLPYLGTGWLLDRGLVVTNRHVAELMARSDSGAFRFRPGRLGEKLSVTIDHRHELASDARAVRRVRRVLWIESDPNGPDIAFLEVEDMTSSPGQPFIPLADQDAMSGDEVVVIGYPARAPAHIIPDQSWMDKIYGGVYDVKRIAPGLMGVDSRGWATHDCTTLGGNSGSVVVDMKTGRALALHFAGLYMIENYAVPASTIRKYLKDRPWHGESVPTRGGTVNPDGTAAKQPLGRSTNGQGGVAGQQPGVSHAPPQEVSITIPLKITVSLGTPQISDVSISGLPIVIPPATDSPPAGGIENVARELFREHRLEGVYSVWPGYVVSGGELTDDECLVVSAAPSRIERIRQAMPRTYGGYPVDVRRTSINEQMEAAGILEAPVSSIQYNDDDRTGEGFSFDWVDEEMNLLLHVGPERSWVVLSDFLAQTQKELVSSIYEFHAAHIARAIEKKLKEGASMSLVMATQSRDPKNNKIGEGDFDRSSTFERWEETFQDNFERIFVPLGAQGLVANAYHIKVTVADRTRVWLSSGNWKRHSQPLIPTESLGNPKVTGAAGNREWHVVIENDKLAERFRNHIKADFERSLQLGGTPESLETQMMVDVPVSVLEAIELEAAPAKVIEPLKIARRVRVQPLLTPDKKGAVFSNAVLRLIRSARKQVLFQNQYIKMSGADGGFLKQLVDALAEKAGELDDVRIILRSGNQDMDFDLSQLKRRGVDVNNQVRILANTHTKGVIVDGRRVLLGSHNWSSSGVTLNRDASLIFDDEEVAQYYLEAFELDWDRARPPRFEEEAVSESARPAEGPEPPLGFVRMPLSDYLEG